MGMQRLFQHKKQHSVHLLLLVPLLFFFIICYGKNPHSEETAYQSTSLSAKWTPNDAIVGLKPALAVRASGCITCHAKIHSNYITDFGYGDNYFFGNPGGGGSLGPFNGNIYGDFYGAEPNKTAWLTAKIDGEIIVPQTRFDFNLSDAAQAGIVGQSAYQQALGATSLAQYLRAVENQKPNPATVIEKKKIFIGAPDIETLEARFGIAPGSDVAFKYIKTDDNNSPDIKGIALSPQKDYYTNVQEISCDGDLFIRGTLFLNKPLIETKSGCRIYATGPIFLQNTVQYKSYESADERGNLQLVSAEAVLLGIGDKNCKTTENDSPISTRLLSSYALSSFITRDANRRSINPQKFSQNIYDRAKRISALEDASCHDDTLSFSGLLLNAPQVHSRYKGEFKGVVIAEFALFRLGQSSFTFDPVFTKVPVLRLLKDSDYLLVQ